jgi:hypothetical protein
MALAWGEPKLAIRGIAYVATLLGFSGTPGSRRRAYEWLAAGEKLAHERDDRHAFAFCQVGRGMIECCAGEWRKSIATFDAAAATLDECAASGFESVTAKNTSLFSLVQLGDIQELDARATAFSQEARKRGDLALEVEANLYLALTALGRDDAADAHRCVDRNLTLWTLRGYHFQHWIALRFRTLTRLYEGAFLDAVAQIDEELPRARAANLTAMQVVRIEAHDLHGRASLDALQTARSSERSRLIAGVKADIKQLERERRPHATAPARALRAGLALLEGNRKDAVSCLERGIQDYEAADMPMHALMAKRHLAKLKADHARLTEIDQTLVAQGISAPERWARMHLALDAS